jgi:hypothetical protein
MAIIRNEETEEIKDQYKGKIEKSDKYIEYVKSDDLTMKFSELLEQFLAKYFKRTAFKPLTYKFLMFIFPGEEYKEPMIKIIYPDNNDFNNLEIRDEIEEKFKQFLTNNSTNLEEFKDYRNIQKKFRFVIQRE